MERKNQNGFQMLKFPKYEAEAEMSRDLGSFSHDGRMEPSRDKPMSDSGTIFALTMVGKVKQQERVQAWWTYQESSILPFPGQWNIFCQMHFGLSFGPQIKTN